MSSGHSVFWATRGQTVGKAGHFVCANGHCVAAAPAASGQIVSSIGQVVEFRGHSVA